MSWRGNAHSKYRAKKTVADGLTFASQKEARRYMELRLLERAGEIRSLDWQVPYILVVNKIKVGAYIADFFYQRVSDDEYVVEDVKSAPTKTPVYRLKKKLVKALYGIDIQEV